MANRYDYLAYDTKATHDQATFKQIFTDLSNAVDAVLGSPRAKALAQTKLEEAYMWIGKAIRDDQIERNGSAQLEEERSNS